MQPENTTVTDQIRRINEKLDRLRNRDTAFETFGASSHHYELRQPLTEDAVAAWERDHGVSLPNGFRAFLLHLGDGGAGPEYGVYSLEHATKESADYRNDLAGLFPITAAHAARIIERRRDEYRYHVEDLPVSLPGVLCIHHAGCHHYHFLVLTGELRGTVWYGGMGWCPSVGRGDRPQSFLDWYEAWLDRSLSPGVLRDTDAVFDHPDDVTGLNFENRGLAELPPGIGRMTRLEKLRLSRNELRELPAWVGDLSNLTHLGLANNKLESLPESLGRLDRLESLWLFQNPLARLPDSLGRLAGLEILSAGRTALTEFPDSIGGLAALEQLSASGAKLLALPESISGCAKLRDLDLGRNALTHLPASLGRLAELRELSLGGNRLGELPDSLGDLPRLWRLDLSQNPLRRLPACVGRMRDLKQLSLARVPELDVAEALGVLAAAAALRSLGLSASSSGSVPAAVGRLVHLDHLNLSWNNLTELPDELAELPNLATLDLSHNTFATAPEVLRRMPGLKALYLRANPLPDAERKRVREWLPTTRSFFV